RLCKPLSRSLGVLRRLRALRHKGGAPGAQWTGVVPVDGRKAEDVAADRAALLARRAARRAGGPDRSTRAAPLQPVSGTVFQPLAEAFLDHALGEECAGRARPRC